MISREAGLLLYHEWAEALGLTAGLQDLIVETHQREEHSAFTCALVAAILPRMQVVLNLGSSESQTHGQQQGSVWNGYFGRTGYHPLCCVLTKHGDVERDMLRSGFVPSADE